MKKIGLYAGSFDPPTKGHIEIVESGSRLLDQLFVGIGVNPDKKYRFSLQQRMEMLKASLSHLKNVEVKEIKGLTVECAKNWGVNFLVRGMRNTKDAEREIELAIANSTLYPNIQTIIVPANMKIASISSSLVREVLDHGGDASRFVPEAVFKFLKTQ